MSDERKETISARVDSELARDLERLANAEERSRSEMIERCLRIGVEAERERVESAEGAIIGPVIEACLKNKVFLRVMKLFTEVDLGEVERSLKMIAKAKAKRSVRGVVKEA